MHVAEAPSPLLALRRGRRPATCNRLTPFRSERGIRRAIARVRRLKGPMDLTAHRALMRELAATSGEFLRSHWGQPGLAVETKADASPVTAAAASMLASLNVGCAWIVW